MTGDLDYRSPAIAAVHSRHQAVFHAKLCLTGSLGWLCAWVFIPGAFKVWLALVGIYSLLLASFAIAGSLGYRGSVAQREWHVGFFRTSGWLVMSGVLSIMLVLVFVVIRVLVRVAVSAP